MKILGVDVVFNHADYRLMSRRALEGLSEYKEVNLFLRGIVPLIGFKSDLCLLRPRRAFRGRIQIPLKKDDLLRARRHHVVQRKALKAHLQPRHPHLRPQHLRPPVRAHLAPVRRYRRGLDSHRRVHLAARRSANALPRRRRAATSAKFTAKSSSAPVSSSKPISKPNRKKKSWTNTDTLTKPDPELSQQFGISFPAAHGMLSLRGTFYEKFAFGASKFFLGSVFGCVFVLLLFFTQCTYAKKQTFLLSNIALLLFGIALFVLFLSLDRLQQVKLSWASADRIVRCAHIRSVSAFIFRTALYFL